MKNIIIIILIIAILIFALLYFNSCRKNSEKDENISETVSTVSEIAEESVAETNSETSAATEQAENTDQTSVETTSAIDGSESGGGNPDVYDVIEITVSEDKYYKDHKEITLEEFKEFTKAMDSNTTVKIYDNYATDKAYSALIDYLNEKSILYSEEE